MPPARRRMGFVFQSYALFPTKTVADNIGFALTIGSRARTERERRRGRAGADSSKSTGCSIAIRMNCRAASSSAWRWRVHWLADPEVLLLDEPMSALDARIRVKLRNELRAIVDRLGITTLYVTHDQEEALAMSDRVAVMRNGRIEQIGTPGEDLPPSADPGSWPSSSAVPISSKGIARRGRPGFVGTFLAAGPAAGTGAR